MIACLFYNPVLFHALISLPLASVRQILRQTQQHATLIRELLAPASATATTDGNGILQCKSHRTFDIRPDQLLSDLQNRSLGSVLPLKTLQNVRDLTLRCRLHNLGEPEWPTTWSQLTDLTRLAFQCFDHVPNYHLPEFLTSLRGLRNLELKTQFSHSVNPIEDYLVLVASCLTQLTRLQMNVVNRWAESSGIVFEEIEQVCQTVSQRVPRMLCTLLDVVTQSPYSPEWSLTFTCDG